MPVCTWVCALSFGRCRMSKFFLREAGTKGRSLWHVASFADTHAEVETGIRLLSSCSSGTEQK